MARLSTEKMQEIRKSKNYTYEKIAQITGISRSTIEKIFSGNNSNPTISYIQAIAQALECAVDDFFDYEDNVVSPYYLDRKTGKLAQEIFENPELKILLDASKELEVSDLNAVIEIVKRMKKTKS